MALIKRLSTDSRPSELALAFLVGLGGWLFLIAWLGGGPLLWAWPAAAGFAGGLLSPSVPGALAFTGGAAPAYAIKFSMAPPVFLGENFEFFTLHLFGIAWIGFAVGLVLRRRDILL